MKLLNILNKSGYTYYQSDRVNLDNFYYEPYQDEGAVFTKDVIFERENKHGGFREINITTNQSLFKYFLDGSRYTYKLGDLETTDGKFMPIVAGQLATGVCIRDNLMVSKYKISKKNALLLYNNINQEDFNDMKKQIERESSSNVLIELEKYQFHKNDQVRPENQAIAKLQLMMMDMEISILTEMVNAKVLRRDEMLVIDGSLQFMKKSADDRLFTNVIGLSKSFNPNLQLHKNSKQIGAILAGLQFGQRTPVYKYPIKNRVIGAWYLRIRPPEKVNNKLDGIVKVEKIAVSTEEKEEGFESGLIDNISQSILLERNATCYGSDPRWANHIYPIYLTEKMLKESFMSATYFLNIF